MLNFTLESWFERKFTLICIKLFSFHKLDLEIHLDNISKTVHKKDQTKINRRHSHLQIQDVEPFDALCHQRESYNHSICWRCSNNFLDNLFVSSIKEVHLFVITYKGLHLLYHYKLDLTINFISPDRVLWKNRVVILSDPHRCGSYSSNSMGVNFHLSL